MRSAIVSGISGHLGQELARQLGVAGVELHGLTRQPVVAGQFGAGGARLHRLDGRTETLTALLEAVRPDVIFHVASEYRREHRSADVIPLVEANVLFGAQLLEGMRLCGCRRLITASTYFQHFGTDDYRALNLYAATKQAFEDLLAYYVDAFDFSAACLTLYEVYSEHDTRTKLMTLLATAASAGAPVNLPDEEFWIDLVHVEDAAAAFVHVARLLEEGALGERSLSRYSVCSGRDLSSTELVDLFERIGARKLSLRRGGFSQPARRMDRPWRGAPVPRWKPVVRIEDGIARMLKARR